jgi:hypothetical protein
MSLNTQHSEEEIMKENRVSLKRFSSFRTDIDQDRSMSSMSFDSLCTEELDEEDRK